MVIALDVGTSSTRASLYDAAGRPVPGRFRQIPYEPTVTRDGGVEHDAARLLEAVAACLDGVLAGHKSPVRAVGVTTFWHGLLGFDSRGRPATPIYMWADTRSVPEAQLLRAALDDGAVHARTGCHLHASYWPAKLRWLNRERPAEVRRVARWGSFGEHLELELFGEAATSVSMASATGLLDQASARWDREALAAGEIDDGRLFPLRDWAEARRGPRAPWAMRWPALRGADWFPAVGDGAAGNVGSDCTDPSRIALNVGTSAALRVVTTAPLEPPRGLWRYRLDRRPAPGSPGAGDPPRAPRGRGPPARARLRPAGAVRRTGAHHRRVGGRPRPLPRVDTDHRRRARPADPVVARERGDEPWRRAAGPRGPRRPPGPRHHAPGARGDVRPRPRPPRALPRRARAPAPL